MHDPDWTWRVFEPVDPLLEEFNALWLRVFEHNGGSPGYARTLRRLLREAGFADTEAHPRLPTIPPIVYGREAANTLRGFGETILAQGWADSERLEAIGAALKAWGERTDAQFYFVIHRVLGWVK